MLEVFRQDTRFNLLMVQRISQEKKIVSKVMKFSFLDNP